ncbi:type I-F CRISPR-associated helicase Cas3f [Vibrio spartinae]|uniref:CRISPR-associated nuclease/helicase Cas3 subtype I-F/YPEST n=1 Tax=Vibrio spartinae TaxID=1918945 RepID=A0A1N6M521_9VIBR|nr:type I-F CRISPR-associated helicase Cas3f [Vibrio spartinae]SIO94541.1 CRISPR-associated nuclease/helicase Cas3 subtype I-F/YPEST [Vibrio spartinae]
MMVTFVSECEKNALKKTRRVLDAFADRIGNNTWQTLITEDGLQTVRKMLKQTASRSTAVSCHWIRSRSRSQLLWVVGNRAQFNLDGLVAVNRTSLNLEHREWESGWYLHEIVALASAVAGLFHDFGKANALFQHKLQGTTQHKGEPYRHEWISLRLFEAFTKGKTDSEWIQQLAQFTDPTVAKQWDTQLTQAMFIDAPDALQNPFAQFAPFAKLIAWLVVSHHRLPKNNDRAKPVNIEEMAGWLDKDFDCHWNSPNALDLSQYSPQALQENWTFPHGTPMLSRTWQRKAAKLALRLQKTPLLVSSPIPWFEQRFVSHMARLSLMLADHYYSSLSLAEGKTAWQDPAYQAVANTDRPSAHDSSTVPKQQLDEHNIGVCVNAQRFARNLPALKYTLPAITQHRIFSKSAGIEKYRWQDKAYAKAKIIAKATERQGFFGVNMASTGCGKTIANARFMYGLADEREGCRFSVALGLRTLTLQTGDAYRDLLKLGDDDLAVLIGSQAVQALHQLNHSATNHGSESAEDWFEQLFIHYEGQIYDGRLKHWLSASPKLEQLVSAPILVSTIDHLMPATESQRGGKQIAPMLRLLTADLVLDEPDDFGLEDLPALCRLVNWAGMLGSRVLLSSATLPPSLIKTLFDAYQAGRKQYNQAQFADQKQPPIWCGWIDEFTTHTQEITQLSDFTAMHRQFVDKRVTKLSNNDLPLRQGKIVTVEPLTLTDSMQRSERHHAIYDHVAHTLYEQIHQLHQAHTVEAPNGKRVSLGVIRMANINPMVATAQALTQLQPLPNFRICYCVYHAQFPLALRSDKEHKLDRILDRHDPEALWQYPEVKHVLETASEENIVFVVLGTSVVEVGRDHDYDWAIAEPSSMRALIQLAGRIQRHRRQIPTQPNLMVLNQNIKALKGESVAYCHPGFESKALPLACHDISELLQGELAHISAITRVKEPDFGFVDLQIDQSKGERFATPVQRLTVQEHRALRFALTRLDREKIPLAYQSNKEACLWWAQPHAMWNAEFIRQTEFRKSAPQEPFVLRCDEEEQLEWCQLDTSCQPYRYVSQSTRFHTVELQMAPGCQWWFTPSPLDIYTQFAEQFGQPLTRISSRLGEIQLRTGKQDQTIEWAWHEQLGVFQPENQ